MDRLTDGWMDGWTDRWMVETERYRICLIIIIIIFLTVWDKGQHLLKFLHSCVKEKSSDNETYSRDLVLDGAVHLWECSGSVYSGVMSHDTGSCRTLLPKNKEVLY